MKLPDTIQRNQAMSISLFNPIVADLFLEAKAEVLNEEHIFDILELANKPISTRTLIAKLCQKCGCDTDAARTELTSLFAKGILKEEEQGNETISAMRHWEKRGWLEALIFHAKTSNLEYADVKEGAPPLSELVGMDQIILPGDMRDRGDVREGIVTKLSLNSTLPSNETLEEILLRRRTGENPRGSPAKLDELSAILLWANLKGRVNRALTKKNLPDTPSAALLWSSFTCLETYLVANEVDGLKSGIYFYDVRDHELVLQKEGQFSDEMSTICIGQPWPKQATFTLMITCDWLGYQARYKHPRAYRNLLINAGELAQRYLIGATSLKFSNFITPALQDVIACELFGLSDEKASPLYALSFA